MALPIDGWKNKGGTGKRSCSCGSWKEHWKKEVGKAWPEKCFRAGCNNKPVLGAHLYNTAPKVTEEYIAPFCDSCNKLSGEFNLKGKVTLAFANKDKSCEK